MIYILLIVIFLLMFFQNITYEYIPYIQYLDEIICLVLLVLAGFKLLKSRGVSKHIKDDENYRILLYIVLLFISGILSTFLHHYVTDILTIVKDIMLCFKFFVTYICASYVLQNYHSKLLGKYLILIAKCLLLIIFTIGLISLIINYGANSSLDSNTRYGIKPYQFLYSHYTYLVFYTVILLCTIMCEGKNNYFYDIAGIIVLLLTLRTKAFMFVCVYIVIKFILVAKNRNWNIKNILKIRYIIPIIAISLMVAYTKIKQYISWGSTYNLRNGLHIKGIEIAIDFFPLGTGFGTFATNLSYRENSPIYSLYNMLKHQGFSNNSAIPMSDVFWPSIYGQYGFSGFIFYTLAVIYIIKSIIYSRKKVAPQIVLSKIMIIIYLIISSIAEASFTNETGVFSIIFIMIFDCFKSNENINYKI